MNTTGDIRRLKRADRRKCAPQKAAPRVRARPQKTPSFFSILPFETGFPSSPVPLWLLLMTNFNDPQAQDIEPSFRTNDSSSPECKNQRRREPKREQAHCRFRLHQHVTAGLATAEIAASELNSDASDSEASIQRESNQLLPRKIIKALNHFNGRSKEQRLALPSLIARRKKGKRMQSPPCPIEGGCRRCRDCE